jgi:hypothetical protein
MRGAIKQTTTPTGSNVVALPKRPTGADAIVAEVMARSRRQTADITQRLRECVVLLEARHRERVNELCPIGLKMDRPTLDSFIEIGQRLLAGRGV